MKKEPGKVEESQPQSPQPATATVGQRLVLCDLDAVLSDQPEACRAVIRGALQRRNRYELLKREEEHERGLEVRIQRVFILPVF